MRKVTPIRAAAELTSVFGRTKHGAAARVYDWAGRIHQMVTQLVLVLDDQLTGISALKADPY
jgi:hypothetical protein